MQLCRLCKSLENHETVNLDWRENAKQLEHCRRATTLKGGRNSRVFVKNQRGEPLMPCSNKKARLLLKENKAKIIQYNPFTIQLTQATGETIQAVHIGVDTGAKYIGIAITSENNVLVKGEVELRDDVSDNVKTRAMLRNSRRSRKTRYRPARFLNRKRPEGWLPPSVKSKLDATFFWIDKFCGLVPNSQLHIEVGKFDVAKMINPDIQGEDYQNGNCKGYFDVRYFVFARDGYTCQVCKKKNKILRTHHIVYVSEGGTNRANNLITVCDDCHTSENHKSGGVFYKWMKQGKKVKQYKEATFMNIVRKRTFCRYPDAVFCYGSDTTPKRKEIGLDKTHYNDAIVISGVDFVKLDCKDWFYYKQFRKKKRSLHESIPRRFRSSKNVGGVRSNKNVKFRNGVWLNDEFEYDGQYGWVCGFSGGEKSKEVVIRNIDGEIIKMKNRKNSCLSIKSDVLRLCRHNNGWQFSKSYLHKNKTNNKKEIVNVQYI